MFWTNKKLNDLYVSAIKKNTKKKVVNIEVYLQELK